MSTDIPQELSSLITAAFQCFSLCFPHKLQVKRCFCPLPQPCPPPAFSLPFTCPHGPLQSWSLPPPRPPPGSGTLLSRGIRTAWGDPGVGICREVPVSGGRSSRAPGPGCSGWRDPGREGVPCSPGPGPGMGRGPGEGRGDSRFADITAGVGAARGPAAPPPRPLRTRACPPAAPRNHRSPAPAPPVSGGLRRGGSCWGLLGDPRGCRTPSQDSARTLRA